LCLVIALACGCENRCVRNSDCPPGYLCQASGMCDVGPLVQPGQVDGGDADSGAGAESVEAPEAAEPTDSDGSPATPGGGDDLASEPAASGR
jgi:hypothetical protein